VFPVSKLGLLRVFSEIPLVVCLYIVVRNKLFFFPQRSCGCSIPGGIQGQFGWGPGQPDLAVGSPDHSREVETE